MSQRILITGCSSGIGRALAAELANRGHEVIATTRLGEGLEDLDVAHRLALDVTSTASVEAAAHAIGPVDVVVNNAGVTIWGAVEAPGEAEVQRLFDTNVFGPLRVLRAILPAMREQGHGAIYQISSAAAKRSTALLGHYAASKAALDAYSEALRIELAPFGIAVCIVSLGPVESSFGVNRREFTPPPYAELTDRMKARIATTRKAPSSAQAVALRLADQIEAGVPPLRFDGSGDAFALIAEREGIDPVQWEADTLGAIWGKAS